MRMTPRSHNLHSRAMPNAFLVAVFGILVRPLNFEFKFNAGAAA